MSDVCHGWRGSEWADKKPLLRFFVVPKVVLLSFISRNKICFYRRRVIMRNGSMSQCTVAGKINRPSSSALKREKEETNRPPDRPGNVSWRPLFAAGHFDGNYYNVYRCSMTFSPWPSIIGRREGFGHVMGLYKVDTRQDLPFWERET